jgi:O-antigen ligase
MYMAVYIFYFILFAFWTEHSLGFELERLFSMSMGFSLKNISFLTLTAAWFITVRRQQQLYLPTNINKYIVLLVSLVLLSLLPVFSGYVRPKTGIIPVIVAFKGLVNPWLFFFFVSHIINSKNECRKSIWGLLILLVVNLITTLLSSYGLIDIGPQTGRKYTGRASGFAEANQYAAFIVLLIPQFLSMLFTEKDARKNILGGILGFIALLGLVATVSRGGLVAFLASLVVFSFLGNKKGLIDLKTVVLSFVGLSLILVAGYFAVPQNVREVIDTKVFSKENPEDFNPWERERTWVNKYSSSRTEIWSDVLNEFLNKPLAGLGLNGYKEKRRIATHNEYLRYMVDHGIFGLFLYLMICTGILTYMYKAYLKSNDPVSDRLYVAYLAGICGYFVAMLAVNMYEPRDIFWLYTAVMYKYAYLENTDHA